jgi:hypothetical protein
VDAQSVGKRSPWLNLQCMLFAIDPQPDGSRTGAKLRNPRICRTFAIAAERLNSIEQGSSGSG